MNRPTVLITGSAARLGKATAQEFFTQGCNLVLHYNQSHQSAKALYDYFNQQRANSCQIFQADFSQADQCTALISHCIDSFGRLDHLINNASIFYPTPMMDTSSSLLANFVTTNWVTPVKLIRAAANSLKAANGSVVNLIDIYAKAGLAEHTCYVAAKAGLEEASKQLAIELAPRVRVNCVSPGAILWPHPEQQTNSPEEKQKQQSIIDNTALKNLGQADNISRTVCFLSLKAHYTTGSTINVDGGRRDYI